MAIVTRKASNYVDTTSPPITQLAAEVDGRGHVAPFFSTVEMVNGDSNTSTIYFGEIPSNARFGRGAALDNDAIAGNTAFSLGLGQGADLANYVAKSATCLINAADIHLAGSKGFTAIDIADLGKAAWQIAGYTEDPGGSLSVVGTLGADLTGGGTLSLSIPLHMP